MNNHKGFALGKAAIVGAVALVSTSIAGSPAHAVTFDEQGRAVISGMIASKFLPAGTIVGSPSEPEDTNNGCCIQCSAK